MVTTQPLLVVRGLVKNYQALRPLRIEALTIAPGAVVTISGLDAPAAEMLVGLVTGAVLPDSGEVRLFGQSTGAVADSEAWLEMLDGIGILTDRLPAKLQSGLRLLNYGLIIAFLAYLVYYGIYLSWVSRIRTFQGIPDVSYSWVTMSLPVGAFLLLITTWRKVRAELRGEVAVSHARDIL